MLSDVYTPTEQAVADQEYRDLGYCIADLIRANMQHDVQNVIVNGNWLLKVKSVRPGEFLNWLSQQRLRFRVTQGKEGFKISQGTAYNWMNVAARFGSGSPFTNFVCLNLSTLYELAAPGYPLDKIQQAIDDYIFGMEELPPAMQEAVDNGAIGERQAWKVVDAASKVDPAIKRVLEVRVITDPDIIPLLQEVGEKAPDLLQEIVRTGAIQSGDTSIMLDKANARDVKAAYVEKRFNDALGNWQDSRTVILQHAKVEVDQGKITVVLPKQDEPLPPNGNFFITVTYQVEKPIPPALPTEKEQVDAVQQKLLWSQVGERD